MTAEIDALLEADGETVTVVRATPEALDALVARLQQVGFPDAAWMQVVVLPAKAVSTAGEWGTPAGGCDDHAAQRSGA